MRQFGCNVLFLFILLIKINKYNLWWNVNRLNMAIKNVLLFILDIQHFLWYSLVLSCARLWLWGSTTYQVCQDQRGLSMEKLTGFVKILLSTENFKLLKVFFTSCGTVHWMKDNFVFGQIKVVDISYLFWSFINN